MVFVPSQAMKTDIIIARESNKLSINDISTKIGINSDLLEPYGRYMAKVPYTLIDEEKVKRSKLILVTAITPTKAGIGKTTTSIGLAMGMKKIGKKAIVALREPSLGPSFGMKGGAAGGGYAQVVPMEKINLHFTGDFHAITAANNLIAALLDNYIFQRQKEGFGMKKILWKRVMDINDRSLRHIVTGLGLPADGIHQETGFDITPASELMAILCLSKDIEDLERRINQILLGYTFDDKPFYMKDLGVSGAITALLLDAINPNLVQTIENAPAFIHGGPFANIAHGCNSVIATKMAMTFGEYAITEAGFGADLGAEKFLDIKCRKTGISPALTILVTSLQGMKMHGGVDLADIKVPNKDGIIRGFANMDKHIKNLHNFGQTVLVCLNRFDQDTEDEIDMVRMHCEKLGVAFAVNDAYKNGGKGAVDLANLVIKTIDENPSKPISYAYTDEMTLKEKIEAVALNIYGAQKVSFSQDALNNIKRAEEMGYSWFPVCIAKTQFSFSQDPKAYGVPTNFTIDIKDVMINAGAEMLVAIAGNIIRMPGLPKDPQAMHITVNNGVIDGLS